MNLRQQIIQFAHQLSEQDNAAFSLWTWLPSHKAATAAHGDYADTFTPSVQDVLSEAAIFIAHGLQPTPDQLSDEPFYACPCGEPHTGEPQ